ncbi:hypothetical protein MJO47_06930 [Desulfuromonas sp. KJ2020]|uniref:selenite/tellurite reduction operon rhodanese-like protein ExtH n=1 Tax=Desulfuromonas sp. KJ2020 TaxID=2919173 RepID=UPI0020A72D7A|nr:selenite/tellurite reduction operon rhodanese-like protein ExtH [Desulfuromonas sp. KJ2020]MCP3176834.1 hypothetical protein [Desulfuromonas sp. KJ2020]
MIRYSLRKTQTKACVIISLLLTLALSLGGCSSDSYDTPKTADNAPVAGAATSVLIEPVTLKGWMDQGLVNSDSTFDTNVVIFDFGGYKMDNTDPDRIKGACRVAKAELDALRFEGVSNAFPLAPPGAQMDALMQKLGINENSTIVFTTSSPAFYATRAYWVFRYWGFPKERLKFLNGGNTAFATAYPELMTTEAPTPVASTYSVKDLPSFNADLRASVGELITILSDLPTSTTNLVLDARGKAPADGASGYFGTAPTGGQLTSGAVVLFDGHPEGGQYLNQADLFASGKFKGVEDIKALFATKGWTADKKTTAYCTTGYSATPLFFAVDALLGADAQLYDGSWSQLGKYSDLQSVGGELPYGSPWAADKYLDISEGAYSYNNDIPAPLTIETLQLDATAEANAPFTADVNTDDSDVNPLANQVEEADALYAAGPATVTFTTPVLTATNEVLISADTLAGWMDAGLVNKAAGSERVVLLDVTSAANYAKAHIPGAQLWDTAQHVMTRTEGPAPAVNMVLDGASMDAMIQATGIDENTTIVITSSQTATYFPSRAYFLFRYWGFPKERIKVLNGFNGAWPAADLTDVTMDLPDSTLSVAALANLQDDTRVSLAELMDALRDGRGTAVDMRGDKSATMSTAGVFSDVAGDYVVFEGTLNGGESFNYTQFNVDYAGGDLRFRSKEVIDAMLTEAGITTSTDGSNPIYSYCRTGYIASVGFFVLDAILDVDVMTYDGSWSQWGKLSTVDTDKGGELPSGSLWAVDNATYMDVINYNADHIKVVEKLNPDEEALDLLPSSADANQVENADELYRTPTSGGTGGSAPDQFTPVGGGC